MKSLTLLSLSLIAVFIPMTIEARRSSRSKLPEPAVEEQFVPGSFTVSSDCSECHQGYALSQITFAGYDKPAGAAQETLFVTNNTDRTLTGVSFYITYLTTDGRQLHNRFVTLDCDVAPGATALLSFKSWDLQKSFHYLKSQGGKRRATIPYQIRLDPVTCRLRF